jgi:outer membrane protein TolC
MPNRARNKRRQEEGEEAELQRRREQSQRDKARNRREKYEANARYERAIQQLLASPSKSTPPTNKSPHVAALEEKLSVVTQVSIMEARSDKFMRDVAKYAPFQNSLDVD